MTRRLWKQSVQPLQMMILNIRLLPLQNQPLTCTFLVINCVRALASPPANPRDPFLSKIFEVSLRETCLRTTKLFLTYD